MDSIQCEQVLTYHDFFERFNAISLGYHACPATKDGEMIGAAIVSNCDGALMASLGLVSRTWSFHDSAFDYEELDLMAQLATNLPKFRGGKSND